MEESLGGRSPGAGVEVGDLRGTVAWGQLPVGQNIRGSIQFWMESWASPASSSPCESDQRSIQDNCSPSRLVLFMLQLCFCFLLVGCFGCHEPDSPKPPPYGVLDIFETFS